MLSKEALEDMSDEKSCQSPAALSNRIRSHEVAINKMCGMKNLLHELRNLHLLSIAMKNGKRV